MNHLASYSKGIGNYDYHKEILKKLAASKIIRNSKSDEIYYRPIRAAVLNLALIYLKENDWEQAKKYLDVLESKYRDTDEYQTAKEADMWKWLSEIKS